jgi:hypothetical protein
MPRGYNHHRGRAVSLQKFRFPIRLNRSHLPSSLFFLPVSVDPRPLLMGSSLNRDEFARCVSAIRIGGTWKTTQSIRHLLSDTVLASLTRPETTILDVGASDGTTSLELIDRLGKNFRHYFVTDAYSYIYVLTTGGITWVYDAEGVCLLRVTDQFVIYGDYSGAIFPLRQIARTVMARAPSLHGNKPTRLYLFQPTLVERAITDPRITLSDWNILTPWPFEPVDLIKCANVLNLSYFSADQIKLAKNNLAQAITPPGRLMVVENRSRRDWYSKISLSKPINKQEQWTLFARTPTGFSIERSGEYGCDIADLLIN